MDLSVIVVSFNGREMTLDCLDAVAAGTKRPHEILLVDNGSSDGTPDAVAARFPAAKVIRNPENRGFAAAVNQGIAASSGRIIVLLNNDARPDPGALDALAAYLEGHAEAGMAGPQLVHEDGRPQNSFDNVPTAASVLLNKALLRALFPSRYPSKRQDRPEPFEVESLIGASLAVKREVVEKIGPLDEDYFIYLEETDWCLRARRAGWKVMMLPSLRVVHLQGRTRARVRARARVEYVRSLFTFFRKHSPGASAFVRTGFLLKTLVEWVVSLVVMLLTLVLWPKARRRCAELSWLLLWQLLLAPSRLGLAPATWPAAPWRGASRG